MSVTQSLINKILYLHSNYEPLIKTCHKYHKSIELWLRNNNIKHEKLRGVNANQTKIVKRFPVFANQQIANQYRLGDHIQFKTEQNGWMHCSVVDSENNWILQRFINNGVHDENSLNAQPRPLSKLSNNFKMDLIQFCFGTFYERLFNYFDADCDGQLNGDQIYDLFVSSLLNTDVLAAIWNERFGDNCATMSLTQSLINKILYLHSHYEPLIKTCHKYHKSIDVWLRNNNIKFHTDNMK